MLPSFNNLLFRLDLCIKYRNLSRLSFLWYMSWLIILVLLIYMNRRLIRFSLFSQLLSNRLYLLYGSILGPSINVKTTKIPVHNKVFRRLDLIFSFWRKDLFCWYLCYLFLGYFRQMDIDLVF